MKSLKYILSVACILVLSANTTFAQKQEVTTEFKVEGVCGECKSRIENAAYIKGVKFCEWNKETEMLKVVYNPGKVTIDAIHASIANAGHDTDKVTADSLAYNKLPKCCAYRSVTEKH